jgi:hypothetical protein
MTKAAPVTVPGARPGLRPPIEPAEARAEALPRPKWIKAKTREDKRGVGFYVGRDAWRQLRKLCADEERSQQDLMIEALDDLFAKYRLARIARE